MKEGQVVARNVTLATVLLAFSKLTAGYITGSLSILADAIHSFADILPIFAAWVGLKIAGRPKDKMFPYGYYKAENLASLFASVFILLLGYEILLNSIFRLTSFGEVKYGFEGAIFVILTIGVSYILYKYQLHGALRTGSQALMVNAKETLGDVLSSVLVFVGITLAISGHGWFEGVVGILISLFVFYEGFESLKDSLIALMDVSVSDEKIKEIEGAILNVPRVKGVKEIVTRRSGPFIFVEATIILNKNLDVFKARNVADEVAFRISEINGIAHASINVVPPEKEEIVIATPVTEKGNYARVFGSAQYFQLYKEVGGKRRKWKRLKNPGFGLEKKRGVKAALFLIDKGVDLVETKKIGNDSLEVLKRAGVDVRIV